MKKLYFTFILSFLICFFYATPCYAQDRLFISSYKKIVEVGDSFTVLLNIPPGYITWTSNNPDIAEVSDIGEIKALSVGATIIQAKIFDLEISYLVLVTEPEKISLLADKSILVLFGERDCVNIKVLEYEIDNTKFTIQTDFEIVYSWGEKKDNSIPLWFEPSDIKCTTVIITATFMDGTSKSIKVYVSNAYDYTLLPIV